MVKRVTPPVEAALHRAPKEPVVLQSKRLATRCDVLTYRDPLTIMRQPLLAAVHN